MKLREKEAQEKKDRRRALIRKTAIVSSIAIGVLGLLFGLFAAGYFFLQSRESSYVADLRNALAAEGVTLEEYDVRKLYWLHWLTHLGGLDREFGDLRNRYRKTLQRAFQDRLDVSKDRLEILESLQAFSEAVPSVTEEPWWAEAGYDEKLGQEIAFVRSWRDLALEITIARDFSERLSAIRAALRSNRFIDADDPLYALMARQYLAGQVVRAIMEMIANPETEGIVRAAVPNEIDALAGDAIPFILIQSRLGEKRLDYWACYRLRGEIADAIDTLQLGVENRRFPVETTLKEIFDVPSAETRRRIWMAVIEEVKARYLFETVFDAWPREVTPLYQLLSDNLEIAPDSRDPLLPYLSSRPIYQAELDVLLALVSTRCLQYAMIDLVKEVQNQMEMKDIIDVWRITDLADRLDDLRPPDRTYLQAQRAYFEDQHQELIWLRDVAEVWNAGNREGASEFAPSFTDLLIRLCRDAGTLDAGVCADVDG